MSFNESMGTNNINKGYTINIKQGGLSIYRTGNLLNFEKDETYQYSYENGKYHLDRFPKGKTYKHFIVCDIKDREKVINIIERTGSYEVTGIGSEDNIPGKWRVWFLLSEEATEGSGVFANNVER